MEDIPTQSLVDEILDELSEFDPYVHKHNVNSVYIHFENLPRGYTHKLRISNHEESRAYGYKWQLRLDGVPDPADRKPFARYYYKAETLIKAFKTYYEKVSGDKTGEDNGTKTGNVWA